MPATQLCISIYTYMIINIIIMKINLKAMKSLGSEGKNSAWRNAKLLALSLSRCLDIIYLLPRCPILVLESSQAYCQLSAVDKQIQLNS